MRSGRLPTDGERPGSHVKPQTLRKGFARCVEFLVGLGIILRRVRFFRGLIVLQGIILLRAGRRLVPGCLDGGRIFSAVLFVSADVDCPFRDAPSR